ERLTREHGQVVEGYRRVVFNYVGSNCDDHTKNFSFLMDRKGKWTLAPAYDIGYSKSAHDQHYMSVVSTRSKATAKDFEDLAASFNIVDWKNMVQEILFAFEKWPVMARELEVPEKNIREIGGKIMENARIIRKGL
ncbi:MAG: HipA domain-containing protein, partial [Chitinispirillia bacterium]|nr:HipA domain-containing protein [Chitinispirillia bacterium]